MCHDDQGDTDKSVTTRQLELIIKDFMGTERTNDLCNIFGDLSKITWQTAASKAVGALARLESFYRQIFKLCKNGCIPKKNLQDALIRIDLETINGHRPRRWNWGHNNVDLCASRLGETIRRGASKLRKLKTSEVVFRRAMNGATLEETNSINRLLESLVIDTWSGTSDVDVARTRDTVDDSGCCMEIFERVMAEGLDKPLLQCGSRESLLSTTSVATSVRTMPFPGPMKSDSDVSSCPPLTMGQLQRLKTLRSSPHDKHTGTESLCGTPSQSMSSLVSVPVDARAEPTASPAVLACQKEVATHLFSPTDYWQSLAANIVDLSNWGVGAEERTKTPKPPRPRPRTGRPARPHTIKIVVAPSDGATKATRRSQVKRNWSGNQRRNYQCRAYKQAYKAGIDRGQDEETARANAQAAYHAAGRNYVDVN